MKHQRKAFTLVELLIIVAFLGAIALIAVPRFNYGIITKRKAEITARRIATDLRLVRRLAISDAANNTKGFELKLVGSIPYSTYEIENVDTKATILSNTLDSGLTLSSPTGTRFIYGPLGSLEAASATQLIVSGGGKTFTITINSATGTVKCVEN